MKTKHTFHFNSFLVILFLVGTISVSCSRSDDASPTQSFSLTITENDVETTFDSENVQVDFGYSEGAGITSFDISIQDYSPQTFTIGLLSYVPEGVPLQENTEYYIHNYELNPETYSFFGMFSHLENFEPITFSTPAEDILYYNTGGTASGQITLTKVTDNEIKGSFSFTAFRINDQLEVLGAAVINCHFVAQKRIHPGG